MKRPLLRELVFTLNTYGGIMSDSKKLNVYDRRFFRRFFMYLIPVIIIFNIGYFFLYQNELDDLINRVHSQQDEEIGILTFILDTYFSQLNEDLNLVYNSSEFQAYIKNPDKTHQNDVVAMFERVMNSKPEYVQLRYLDETGMEIVRVDQIAGEIVNVDDLQDKSNRYYYISAMKTQASQMYISNLDLNVEHGVVVIPYQPVIRFSLPIFSDKEKKGILIVNIDGIEFLSVLDHYQKKDERVISTGIFDNRNFWWVDNIEKQSEKLTLTDLNELYKGSFYENAQRRRSGEYKFGSTYYSVQFLDTGKYLFEGYYSFGLLSSFDIDEAILASDNVILTNDWIRYVMMLLLTVGAWHLTVYLLNKESEQLMIFASGYISLFSYDGVVITGKDGNLIFCNGIFENTFGYTLEELKEDSISNVILKNTEIQFSENAEFGDLWEGHVWNETKYETHVLKYLRVKGIKNKYNRIMYYVGIFSEPKFNASHVLHSKEFWTKYHYLKSDIVTLEKVFSDFAEKVNNLAVFAIKLSDLGIVKRALYQEDSSIISKVISEQLSLYLTVENRIAFISDDLIVLAIRLDAEFETIESLMDKIDKAFYSLRLSDSEEDKLNYLVGVSIAPDHGNQMSTLINNAFISLEALTKIKMTKYLVYDSYLFESVKREIQIQDEIETGFRENELYLAYQLQKNLCTEEIVGVEALIRWNSSKLGPLMPNEFIPIMEETEYVKKIAAYVLKRAIEDFQDIRPYMPSKFRISINLTEPEFMDEDIITELVEIILDSTMEGEQFCFEITESILIESLTETIKVIDRLHESDITVAIDDFGTGYSSLSYLKELKADKLKIDRAFIKDYPDKDNGTLIKAIFRLTDELHVETLIEGVETYEQHQFCLECGCMEYQGYYGSRPVDKEEIKRILKEHKLERERGVVEIKL